MAESGYGRGPNYPELVAIVLIGAGHILTELSFSATAAVVYNVAVSVGFLGYLFWRFVTVPEVSRRWGFRTDNIGAALKIHMPFVAAAIAGLAVFAVATAYDGLPVTFWLTVALYPVWGIAQQFALQNLIANNVEGLMERPLAIATVAAFLFAVSHYPRFELVALTFFAGIFLTLAHRRQPNIWVVGTVHGVLGSLAFYIVLGEDPGALILDSL